MSETRDWSLLVMLGLAIWLLALTLTATLPL